MLIDFFENTPLLKNALLPKRLDWAYLDFGRLRKF